MVIFGGSNEEGYMNDVHIFDTLTNIWRKMETTGEIPVARDHHISCTLNNHMIVHGGDAGSFHLGDMFALNVMSSTWTKMGAFGVQTSEKRAGHSGKKTILRVRVFIKLAQTFVYDHIFFVFFFFNSYSHYCTLSMRYRVKPNIGFWRSHRSHR